MCLVGGWGVSGGRVVCGVCLVGGCVWWEGVWGVGCVWWESVWGVSIVESVSKLVVDALMSALMSALI